MRLGDGGEPEMRHKRSCNNLMRPIVNVNDRDASFQIMKMWDARRTACLQIRATKIRVFKNTSQICTLTMTNLKLPLSRFVPSQTKFVILACKFFKEYL